MIGWLKQIINPTEKQDSRKRYRYIPGDLAEFNILNEKEYICSYNKLQKAYLEDEAKCTNELATWNKDDSKKGKTF